MIEKLAQFTDIKCCLIVGGLSTKVWLLFQFHDALISKMWLLARIELCASWDTFCLLFRFTSWTISSTALCLLYTSINIFLSVWHLLPTIFYSCQYILGWYPLLQCIFYCCEISSLLSSLLVIQTESFATYAYKEVISHSRCKRLPWDQCQTLLWLLQDAW